MAAAITDLITQATTSSRPTPTQVTSTRSAAGTTLACNALTGWPTATAVHFCTYKINTSGAKIAGSQIDMKGIVSGTNITNVTIKAGTDVGNAVGDIVEAAPTAAWANDVVSWGTAQHTQLGAHTGVTTDTLSATTSITDGSGTLQTMRSEQTFDYVASGCVITGTGLGTTLGWSMTSGVVYIGGKRLTVASASGTVTASKDTYFDLLDPGTGTVATLVNTGGNILANNAASVALAASSVRIGIVVSGATIAAAASINQGQEDRVLPIASSVPYAVTDSLGNLICSRDPNRKILGYRQITSTFSTGATSATQVTGLSCPVIIPAGRKVKVNIFGSSLDNTASGALQNFTIWDGTVGSGTQLQVVYATAPAVNRGGLGNGEIITTPSTTSKTYNVSFHVSTGTGSLVAATTGPAFIRVELV